MEKNKPTVHKKSPNLPKKQKNATTPKVLKSKKPPPLSNLHLPFNIENDRKQNESGIQKTRTKESPTLVEGMAAHFGNFYLGKETVETTKPRLEFTREILSMLRTITNKEQYVKQISALLERTVEPTTFKSQIPPADRFVDDEVEASMTLWYKNPSKVP